MTKPAHAGFYRDGSAFRLYMDTVAGVTEAPERFHLATALTVMGTLLGRRFYFPWGKHQVYPINPAILVGPSGIGKGEALGIGKAVIRAARTVLDEEGQDAVSIWLMEDEATPQAITKALTLDPVHRSPLAAGDTPEIAIIAGEMATFLNKSAERDNMVPVLTKLLEQDESYARDLVKDMTDRNRIAVTDPTVNFLAGTTIDWMRKLMPNEMFSGGFFRRCQLVVEKEKGAHLAVPKLLDKKAIKELSDGIIKIIPGIRNSLRREIDFSPSVKWWTAFKVRHDSAGPDDPRIVGHYHSFPQHVQKMALVFAVARGSKVVEPSDCRHAEAWVQSLIPDITAVLLHTEAHGFEDRANLLKRILMEFGEVPHDELWAKIPCPFKEFQDLLTWAEGTGIMQVVKGKRGKKARYKYLGKRSGTWGRRT